MGSGAGMNDAVRELAADSGVLRRVAGSRVPNGRYDVLELTFDHGTLHLSCDDDTDEIVLDVTAPATGDVVEIVDDNTLADLAGKVVELAWIMMNHRGFEDAFQLRCLDLVTRSESCVQFEVAASAMSVARVGS